MESYGRARQATDDNMAYVFFMLDNQGYKHTLKTCNTYCFSIATMVTQTRLSVTLYVHCVYYYNRDGVFTVRYELCLILNRLRFVLKALKFIDTDEIHLNIVII